MADQIQIGDRVKVLLDSSYWKSQGWQEGTVVRIDPYSDHRQFYWVELDREAEVAEGGSTRVVSVLNPARIARL